MNDELAARHRAITLRLAGRPVKSICAAHGGSVAVESTPGVGSIFKVILPQASSAAVAVTLSA